MTLLALDRDLGQYRQLEQAIQDFNATGDEYVSQKIYHLQAINALIDRAPPSPELDQWLADTTSSGWEQQLQKIGVHRDASAFLKSMEFSQVMQRASNTTEAPHQGDTFYTLLAERDALLKGPGNIEAFESINRRLFALSNQDEKLQARMIEHKHFLALGYGKLEAIKDVVEQNFKEYSTEKLSSGNNANFFLNIEGEPNPLVIRVEDRATLQDEADLQSHPVSEYFSEDYATMMLPFKNESGEVGYQPVVLSQFASGGNLSHFAESLADRTSDEKGETAQACFSQLSDFLIKLQDSGHYHPDIKLSNFLYDNGKVFCADRKTFLNTEQASPNKILTTVNLAPPEFLETVNYNPKTNAVTPKYKHRNAKLDMPSFMQYQVGAAINEYLADSDAFADNPLSNQIQNLLILQTELIRENPSDRLNLNNFNQLLTQLDTTPEVFLTELEKLHPTDNLSFSQDIKDLDQLLNGTSPAEQVSEVIKKLPERILSDVRFKALKERVDNKINNLEKKLHDEDKALATRTERTFDFLGIRRVPERSQSEHTRKLLHAFKEMIETEQVELIESNASVQKPVIEIKKASSSGENAQKTAEGNISGTCIQTPIAEEEPYNSGTCIQIPIAEEEPYISGTCIQIPIAEEEPYNSGTCIQTLEVGSPTHSNEETEVEQYSPNLRTSENMSTEPNTPMKENMPEKANKPQQKADDIATTIQRGDKKTDAQQDLKQALNELKTENLSEDDDEENMKKPGSTPTM